MCYSCVWPFIKGWGLKSSRLFRTHVLKSAPHPHFILSSKTEQVSSIHLQVWGTPDGLNREGPNGGGNQETSCPDC